MLQERVDILSKVPKYAIDESRKTLKIFEDTCINSMVFKANRFLISHHREELSNLTDEGKKEFLNNVWQAKFRARFTGDSNSGPWTYLEFFSENDMMMFWMKWKS